jgi:hypothetical protein
MPERIEYFRCKPIFLEEAFGEVTSAWPSAELTQADIEAWASARGMEWEAIPGQDGIIIVDRRNDE